AYSSALPPASMNCVLISLSGARPWLAPITFASSSNFCSAASGVASGRSSRNFISTWALWTLCEGDISHDQCHHRDKEHQWYACVDGEHDHRKMVRFEHDRQRDTKVVFGQADFKGYR